MRSEDLIDCQGGSREIPYCQEGKGEKMSSEMSSYQQGQLTEKEGSEGHSDHWRNSNIPAISPVEARVCVADVATTRKTTSCDCHGRRNWSRHQRLPKQKKKMSILRNGSKFSARKLKRRLQH
jgi:hypothetical protein